MQKQIFSTLCAFAVALTASHALIADTTATDTTAPVNSGEVAPTTIEIFIPGTTLPEVEKADVHKGDTDHKDVVDHGLKGEDGAATIHVEHPQEDSGDLIK
jgi:hypothetical protein